MKNITATEIEERYKNMKPLSDPLTELDLDKFIKLMEEMAAAPREDLGKRKPGERQASEIYNENNKNTKI